ncbi:MAG: hypothetical protein OXO49_01870 [Gammaproteobacteria bacterium]|nr:hypothetical protein [Gammaproteobacteria bacterium]MDE0252706.1 hypothetical protein [Gammaproteobacteria bacterium]MDE0402394.1 hypothetical protein [Gammaproteobacteria bacterium]
MKHRFAILCQASVVDTLTHNISLFNLIDRFQLDSDNVGFTERGPVHSEAVSVPFAAHLVVMSERSKSSTPESCEARIVLQIPSGENIGPSLFCIDLSEFRRTHNVIRFNVFPYCGVGRYLFEVEYKNSETGKWEKVDSVPLEVEVS